MTDCIENYDNIGPTNSGSQKALTNLVKQKSVQNNEQNIDQINKILQKILITDDEAKQLDIKSFKNTYSNEILDFLIKYFTIDYINSDSNANSINMKLFVLMGLTIYCEYIAKSNIQDAILYGGIIDWFYHSIKTTALHMSVETSDIDILTQNITQFDIGFKYFIESWIGVSGCVNVLNRKLSPGLTISVFGVKLFDITPCSVNVIMSSIPVAIWNNIVIYGPNIYVLLSQRLLYFQTCNDCSNQLQFHTSDMFLQKGIKGFKLYVKDNIEFDITKLPPIIINKSAQKIPIRKLVEKLSKSYDCFRETDNIILVGDEAVLLIAALALEYKLCTEKEYCVFKKSIGESVVDDNIFLNYKNDHSLWIYATKFCSKLNIDEQPFSFCGPITPVKIQTTKAILNFTLVAGLSSEFMSIKISDLIYITNIFTLFTLMTAKHHIQPQQSTGNCLLFMLSIMSKLKKMNVETPLTGRDKFIQGFYGPNLCYRVNKIN